MAIDETPALRVQSAAEKLVACGFIELFATLVRDVWHNNVARFDSGAGDTRRVIALQSAENLVVRLLRLMQEDAAWSGTGVRASTVHGSLLVECDDLRIRLVKAPQDSRRHPIWHHDFPWGSQSNVRAEAAARVDDVYQTPRQEPGMEALFSAEGLGSFGDANDITDFFIVWAGELSEEPLTAGWLVIPSLTEAQVLASDCLWFDKSVGPRATAEIDPVVSPSDKGEPEVTITVKVAPRQSEQGDAR